MTRAPDSISTDKRANMLAARKRIDWHALRAEVEPIVAAGGSLADIAERFKCTPGTASAGLRRLGLRIDPDAARARRVAKMAQVGADARAIKKRTAVLKQTLRDPEMRGMRSENARRQWLDPDVRGRTIDSLKAAAARLSPDERSSRSAKAGAAKLAWCPPEYRDEYAKLRRGLKSARQAKHILLQELARQRGGALPKTIAEATAELAARIAKLMRDNL